MGQVWRAYDELLDRDVAIKEVVLPACEYPGERRAQCRRVIAEARATARLRHPGVVTVYDVVVEDDHPFIVTELVPARSLHEVILSAGPLPAERAAKVGAGVLAVLRAAHTAGVLHRDVKPSNVLLADDGRIMLTDFGLAVRIRSGDALVDTLVSGIQGSPAYLAPEQVLGRPGDEAADLYSLGVTLYAAVQGASPFQRSHALASMVAVLLGEYAPPRNATPELRRLIDGLLCHEPDERLSASEAALLLDAVRAETTEVAPAPSRRRRRPKAARAGALAGIGALSAVVVTVGAWSARWVSTSETIASSTLVSSAKTVSYRERDGYSVQVPSGWVRVRQIDGVHWDDPAAGRHLRIRPVTGDPLEGLRTAERRVAADPGYRRLRLEATPEIAEGAAEWEYVIRRVHGLRSRIGRYEFAFTASDDRWTPDHRIFDGILRTFRAEG
jgi:eukaryotic-like serine/threonine-protein kinase